MVPNPVSGENPDEPGTAVPQNAGMTGRSGQEPLMNPANLRQGPQSNTMMRAKTIDAVLTQLGNCSFPATPRDIVGEVGDARVPVEGVQVPLREVLETLPQERFDNAAHLKAALVEHWPHIERRVYR